MASKFTLNPVMAGLVVGLVAFATSVGVRYLMAGRLESGVIGTGVILALAVAIIGWRSEAKKQAAAVRQQPPETQGPDFRL